jgi:DNA-directed RNA polymerase specialized sigma24 family protein
LKSKKTYFSREEFFEDKYGSLLENIGFAGQTFEQAFSSNNGRDKLCQLVRGEGVPVSDVEDIVQEISRKFWQAGWVERYNPLISSWRNFLLVPIQRYVNTYKSRRSKKVTTSAVPLDRDDERDDYGNSAASCLYDLSEDEFPEDDLIRQEVMEDWEIYLRSQKPIRPVVRHVFERMCTLLPPGLLPDLPTEEEKDIFFLQGGHYNSRVTTHELYDNGICPMVPNYLLVDYITEDPVDHVQYVDEVTGDFITQKDFPNPNYNQSVVIKEQRTWGDLYDLLMRGLQVEEIARELRMAPPSVPARIQRLESLFRGFWLVSKKIPRESKILAAKTYRCPNPDCRKLDMIEREECRVCGTDMRGEVAKVRFDAYPWPKARVTRETWDRLGNRRQALLVQRCSLSIRF